MEREGHLLTQSDWFHAKWAVIAAILGALAGAGLQYFASRDVTDAKLLEVSQELAKERSRSDILELQLQELKKRSDGRQNQELPSSSALLTGVPTRQAEARPSPAVGGTGAEPPELRRPAAPAADYSAHCGEKTIDLPSPHTGTSFPDGILGVLLLVKPDECWTNIIRAPHNLRPWSVESTAQIHFTYYYLRYGVSAWSNDLVIQPGKRMKFDGLPPWELIRFMNNTGEPAVATVTFYGN